MKMSEDFTKALDVFFNGAHEADKELHRATMALTAIITLAQQYDKGTLTAVSYAQAVTDTLLDTKYLTRAEKPK